MTTDPKDQYQQEGSAEATGPSGTIELFGVQQVHPVRVLTGVTALTVDEHGNLLIDLESWNRGRLSTWVAQRGSMRLEDDLGNTYEPVAPEEDWVNSFRLRLDERAEMTIGFIGPIDPDANRVTLGLNARDSFHEPSHDDRVEPRFTFADLPLPGVGLDEEGAARGRGGLDLRPRRLELDGRLAESDDVGLVGTFEVHTVTVGPLSVELDVTLRNDGQDRARLVRPFRIMAEADGEPLGDYEFEFMRSRRGGDGWTQVTVEPGEELEATLAFRGAVPRDADALRIALNHANNNALLSGEPLAPERTAPNMMLLGIPLPPHPDDEGR